MQVEQKLIMCKVFFYYYSFYGWHQSNGFIFPSKKYQSWGGGKLLSTKEDKRDLKKARTEGRLAEALLDRREKVKADRYCK